MEVMPIEAMESVDENGVSPFKQWLHSHDRLPQDRVRIRIARLRVGNLGDCRDLGGRLWELKDPFGPGLRIYFGREGKRVVILLGGGIKRRQRKDIKTARDR